VAVYSEYVLIDRTTADKRALQVYDDQLKWESSAGTAESEPIVEDKTNPGTYWKIYIDDGQIGWESTATVQDDVINFTDQLAPYEYWQLQVLDGQLYIENNGIVVSVGGVLPWKRRRR
jgi:hypothetical protein